jgi:hypothetical protein
MFMGEVAGRRMTAEIDGDFVVFLIGARFNDKLQFARTLVDLGGRRGMKHMLDVWRQYWRRVGRGGRSGIWHETYLVRAGQYEAVYANMPPHGLGKAGRLVPASESSSARGRLQRVTGLESEADNATASANRSAGR